MLDEKLLNDHGYTKQENGIFSRGFADGIVQGNFHGTIGTAAYGGGPLNKIDSLKGLSANLNASRDLERGATFPIPVSSSERRHFHEEEVGMQIRENISYEKTALDKVLSKQSDRLAAEKKVNNIAKRPVLPFAEASLVKEKAVVEEFKSLIAAKESRDLILQSQIVYSKAPLWWGGTPAEKKTAQENIDKFEAERIPVLGEIETLRKSLTESQSSVSQITKDIESIKKGVIPKQWDLTDAQIAELDALQKVSDFFNEIASKKSIAAADKAKLYNNAAVGKNIKSASQAMALWNRHGASIMSRLNAADKNALSNALNGLKQEQLSKQLDLFGKVLGSVSKNIDRISIVREMSNSVKTGNWQPTFIKIETILAGAAATEIVTLVFSAMAVTPMGIFAFALLLAATSSMIDEKIFEDLSSWISKL